MQIHHPTSLADAAQAIADGATPLAGGTDLMVEVNLGRRSLEHVVALRRVEELADWEGNRIGAGVTWRRLEQEGPLALAEAARTVGSPQIRNAGTIGGNVVTASPAGDGLPFLVAVDAEIEVMSAKGGRLIPWSEFFVGVKKTALTDDELVTSIHLPDSLPERQAFGKVGMRNAMVIATVGCVVTRTDEATTTVGLGSVGPTPLRATRAEEMMSSVARPTERDLARFQSLVAEEARPITDHRATEEYRRHAIGVLARRLLERCLA